MNNIRVAMTGATGLLGRNLLFEFIKQYKDNLDDLKIVILGRREKTTSLYDRVKSIILDDGLPYIDPSDNAAIGKFIEDGIQYVEMDLKHEHLGIAAEDLQKLKTEPIDFFFHVAAATDFRDSTSVRKMLWEANVTGTEQILELVRTLDVKEFSYVSSAYSCGKTYGKILPDYINLDQEFRNPYEQSKLEAEIKTRNFAKETGIRYRCFRPSTICGRLMEKPLGIINKFDVFYGFAAFWLYAKLKMIPNPSERYELPLHIDAAICYSMKSGLDIVPADYAAKVMFEVCMQRHPEESYHLVNGTETPHSLYINGIFESLNIHGTSVVDEMPLQLNQMESFLYKTAGKLFAPYTTAEPMLFDTSNLDSILAKTGLRCPVVDKTNFMILMDYAKSKDFGVNIKKSAETAIA